MCGYTAIGALTHWALLGSTFKVSSVASWGVLLGWPVVLFVLALLLGFAILIVAVLVMSAHDTIVLRRQVRRNRRYAR